MAVQMNCPGCGKRFQAPDEWAGRVAQCPDCKTEFRFPRSAVPAPPRAAPTLPATFNQPQGRPGQFQPQLSIDHRHQATGAFGTGFKFGLGWFLASLLLSVLVGIILGAIYFIQVRNARHEVENVRNEVENAAAKQQRDLARLDAASPSPPRTHSPTPQQYVENDASPPEAPPVKDEPPSSEKPWKIESLTMLPDDGASDSTTFRWTIRIKNNGERELSGRGTINLLDINSNTIESSKIARIVIPPNQIGEVTGTSTVALPAADDVSSATAELDLRPTF